MNIGIRTNEMPMNIKRLVGSAVVFALLAPHACMRAQSVTPLSADSTAVIAEHQSARSNFKATQLIVPGALIAVGTFGVYNGAFRKMDTSIKNWMDDMRGNHYFHADDYIQYLPAATYLAFGAIGIKSKHTFKERLVTGLTAYAAMAALTNIGKYTFKEKRPDSGARNSFPSGHTATVFTGAELMREEYGLGIGIGAYAVATGVAFLRLYNGRHWFNDVLAGAGVGILSARIGYWMLPLYQRWFKWDRPSDDIVVISPGYNHADRTFSLNLAYSF